MYFELTSIADQSANITLYLTEKPDLIPEKLKGKEPVLNGYLNELELQTYPIQGKSCYLKLRRRRWKEKGTDGQSRTCGRMNVTLQQKALKPPRLLVLF
jgi:hypothetical protein